MTPRQIQNLLATVFLGLGARALVFPSQVLRLVIRPEYITHDELSLILMGCFGAQAILGGIVILFSRFTQITFLVFGLVGSLPFFAFNYYFVFINEVFTHWMFLDFVGNIAIFTLCLLGFLKMRKLDAAST